MINLKDSSLLKTKLFFCGEWQEGTGQTTLSVSNPATQKVICEIKGASASDTNDTIRYAQTTLKKWKFESPKRRAEILQKWYELVVDSVNDLALILTLEQGKPLAEAKNEILYGASYIKWFAEEARRIYGDIIPSDNPSHRLLVIKQPVGVVAAITPWNFPCAMVTRKVAPALAAGCTVIVKPAESTPLTALALAELGQRAGIPNGVISVVVGKSPKEIGEQLTSSQIVRKLTFTGSTNTGKLLVEQCAKTLKRTSMELGGNAPFIVFPDADLDLAINAAMNSKFRNAGQTCVCSNRFIIHTDIHDEFVQRFVEKVSELKVGDGLEADVTVGPLIDEQAVNRVALLVENAVTQGANIRFEGNGKEMSGCYYPPTIITGVTPVMDVFTQEIFGPVAPITLFDEEVQAIELANSTSTGLASYIFTQNQSRIWRISEALDNGIVGINEGIISNEMAPFGGVKESGSGREGSKYGIDDYLELKYICLGGLS